MKANHNVNDYELQDLWLLLAEAKQKNESKSQPTPAAPVGDWVVASRS